MPGLGVDKLLTVKTLGGQQIGINVHALKTHRVEEALFVLKAGPHLQQFDGLDAIAAGHHVQANQHVVT